MLMLRVAPLLLFAVCVGPAAVASAATGAWYDDLAAAQDEAVKLQRPLLLHFYADWCFPCKRMEQEVFSSPAVMHVLGSQLVLVKVNVDRQPDVAKRYSVTLYPADVIIDPAGERILTSTGFQTADKYVSFAREAERVYLAARGGNRPVPAETTPVADQIPPVMVALDGFCPVTLWAKRAWIKGDPEHMSEHRGQIYYLATAEEKQAFESDPRRYVPQLLGCDPVVLRDTDLAIPGSVQYGAFYDDELFLFASDENRKAFKLSPDRYTSTRVVRNVDEITRSVVR
jgi:YHS domain-containing protein/thioredoxin-related protein